MVHLIANKVAIKIHFWFSLLVRLLVMFPRFKLCYSLPWNSAHSQSRDTWLYLIIFGTQLNRIKRSWYNFIIITYSSRLFVPFSWLQNRLNSHASIQFASGIFCIEVIIIRERIEDAIKVYKWLSETRHGDKSVMMRFWMDGDCRCLVSWRIYCEYRR